MEHFNISFNISGKKYISRLYLLIICYPLVKKQFSASVLKKKMQIQNLLIRDDVSVKFLLCLHELETRRSCHIRHLMSHRDISDLLLLVLIIDFQLRRTIRQLLFKCHLKCTHAISFWSENVVLPYKHA